MLSGNLWSNMRLNMKTLDFAFLYRYNGQIKLLHQLIQGAETKRSQYLDSADVSDYLHRPLRGCSYQFPSHYMQSMQCSDQPLVMNSCNGGFLLMSWNSEKGSIWGMAAVICNQTVQVQMWAHCTGTPCLAEIGRIFLFKQLLKIKVHSKLILFPYKSISCAFIENLDSTKSESVDLTGRKKSWFLYSFLISTLKVFSTLLFSWRQHE